MDANCRRRRRDANNLLGATFLLADHVGLAFYKWQHILAIICRCCCFCASLDPDSDSESEPRPGAGATQSANCHNNCAAAKRQQSQRSLAQSA